MRRENARKRGFFGAFWAFSGGAGKAEKAPRGGVSPANQGLRAARRSRLREPSAGRASEGDGRRVALHHGAGRQGGNNLPFVQSVDSKGVWRDDKSLPPCFHLNTRVELIPTEVPGALMATRNERMQSYIPIKEEHQEVWNAASKD